MQGLGEQTVRGAEGTHQHDCHNDDGHVAINDGGQATGKAALERAIQRFAVVQLLLDALGGDDVGIHAHTNGQDDTCDAGQSQGKALKHREIAGNEGQRCRHLTGQCNAGQEAGQTIQQSHQHHDEGIGNETGQHHGAQAVLAQAGADGGIAVHSQGKRQCTGIDLAGHLDHVLLREGIGRGTGDDGGTIGDGRIDRCRAHVLIIQPDADGSTALVELRGGIPEGLGTLVVELEGNIIFGCTAAHRAVLSSCALDHGAVQDQFVVCAAPLAEGQVGGAADLFNGGFGVKIGLAGLPRKLQDQAVGVIIHIQLVVGHVQADHTILDDQLGSVQLIIGGIVVVRGGKRYVDTAFDIHAEADILRSLDVGLGHITVLDCHTKECRVDKRGDQEHCDNKLPCFAFRLHKKQETSKI